MARIIWDENAERIFDAYIENAYIEYGKLTAKRWLSERNEIEWRLERYPVSYPPEELLVKRTVLYRRCHLMNRRFKFIYYYDEAEDVVHIIDIWDTKRNPKTLIRRIK